MAIELGDHANSGVLPYVYRLDNYRTGEFYIGFREANNVVPELDLCVKYKTSSKFVKPKIKEFTPSIIAVFYDGNSAFWFEQELIAEHIKEELINQNNLLTTNLGILKTETYIDYAVTNRINTISALLEDSSANSVNAVAMIDEINNFIVNNALELTVDDVNALQALIQKINGSETTIADIVTTSTNLSANARVALNNIPRESPKVSNGFGVARLTDICSGHGPWAARTNVTASENVFINGLGAHRVSDTWESHCAPPGCHDSVLATGSLTVFVNGLALGRIGDTVECGSTVASGSDSVFAG